MSEPTQDMSAVIRAIAAAEPAFREADARLQEFAGIVFSGVAGPMNELGAYLQSTADDINKHPLPPMNLLPRGEASPNSKIGERVE